MAEAHQATSYSTSLIHEHTDANHDQEVLQLVFQSGLRSWRRRFARFRTKIRNGVYPAHLESLWIIIAVVMGFHFYKQNTPFDVVNTIFRFMPEYVNIFLFLQKNQFHLRKYTARVISYHYFRFSFVNLN